MATAAAGTASTSSVGLARFRGRRDRASARSSSFPGHRYITTITTDDAAATSAATAAAFCRGRRSTAAATTAAATDWELRTVAWQAAGAERGGAGWDRGTGVSTRSGASRFPPGTARRAGGGTDAPAGVRVEREQRERGRASEGRPPPPSGRVGGVESKPPPPPPPACVHHPPASSTHSHTAVYSTTTTMPARADEGLWPPYRRFRRTMSAPADPAFKSISKTHTGFHIWRIENMQVVAVPKSTWGSFYDGDSYIIYAASEYGKTAAADAKVYEVKGTGIEIHIHFWLGNDTSQDEAGVAAYKTVELDDYLGGSPVQHREAQGMESGRFKSYFKDGLTILKGGVESGFNTVTDDFQPKLFQVKGRRQPTVTQLPEISWEYFNDGDVFILDTKEVVFLWIGKGANAGEKLKAAVVAGKLRDDHGASSLVFVDDGDEQSMHSGEKKIFNQHLKLSERVIKTAEEAGEDDEAETALRSVLTLYQCSDEDGTYKIFEIKSGPLYQSDLLPDSSFIVDNGIHGCWVWIGRRTPQKERIEAIRNAHGFVTKKGYPATTPVTRVVDGGEPTEFRVLFQSWKGKNSVAAGRSVAGARAAITVTTKLDAATFYEKPQLAADNQLWDDGTGSCTIWRIKNSELEEVPNKLHGLFFAGDSYVIHYSYWANGSEHHVLYYWLGNDTADEEKANAAHKAEDKDIELNGEAVLVRVVQGKEPTHFLGIFQRGILIFNGGYVTTADGDDAEDTGIPETFLLQVQGNNNYNTRATQVDLQAASLDSNDVFVLKGKSNCFVWSGKGSTGDQREMAKHIAEIASRGDFAFVSEGQEKSDFWEEIGGEEDYSSDKRILDDSERLPARLFQIIFKTESIKVEEIINFKQSDLLVEDIMVLDIHDNIYLWIGKNSKESERKRAIISAVRYLETDPKGRDRKTPILQVKQGFEPPTFTGFFPTWDPTLWDEEVSFEKMRSEIEELNPVIHYDGNDDVETAFTSEQGFYEHSKYPLEFLQETAVDELPEDVDKLHKELHLTKEDFLTAFAMDFQTFSELPTWKQTTLKKNVRLF